MKDVSCYIVIGVGCGEEIYLDQGGYHTTMPFLHGEVDCADEAMDTALTHRRNGSDYVYTVQKVNVKITPAKQWVKCTAEELRLHMREVTHIQDDLVGLAQMFVEQRVRFVTSYWEVFK